MLILTVVLSVQQLTAQDDEFMLLFRYPATEERYVSAIYSNGDIFLPLGELFSILEIHVKHEIHSRAWSGRHASASTPWSVDLESMQALMGDKKFMLDSGVHRLVLTDLYLSPSLFEKMFGLFFTVNMSTLSLSLESRHFLPVEERQLRESRRRDLDNRYRDTTLFPLRYPRNKHLFAPGMLDYNLGVSQQYTGNSYNYTVTGALEFMGGDLQGTISGYAEGGFGTVRYNNLQWRFAPSPNAFLSSVQAGQLNTTGLQERRIVGVAISNEPLQPRDLYENRVIEGTTVPGSEVELWVNNQLAGYSQADALGHYRINYPINYGTVRLSVRIYTPTGEEFTQEKQLQIPYTFLPEGVLTYHLQAGMNQYQWITDGSSGFTAHGAVTYGIMRGLTLKTGIDHYRSGRGPMYYGTLGIRLSGQYLLNLDVAPGAYFRAAGIVNYSNNRHVYLRYTKFDGAGIHNRLRAHREFSGNVYLPFGLYSRQHGFRLSYDHTAFAHGSLAFYRIDWNSHLGRMNLRLNYRLDRGQPGWHKPAGEGLLTSAATYTMMRTPGTPAFLRGAFLRMYATLHTGSGVWNGAGVQFSKAVFKTGVLTFSADHEKPGSHTRYQAGLTLDLGSAIRFMSHASVSRRDLSSQQTLTGSLSYDAGGRRVIASSRTQTGQAAISLRMFIDRNGDGDYNQGEELVPVRTIKMNHAATLQPGKDSILRITQLQIYRTYQAEIDVSTLPDPTLAPPYTRFSFIADPNHYKRIDIPLYRTGVIEGNVTLRKDGTDRGLGGIRLLIKGIGSEHEETIRTFSDGGFYAMSLLPGKYSLEVDPTQLGFLHAVSEPGKIEFEVKALPEGDSLDGLNFLLTPDEK